MSIQIQVRNVSNKSNPRSLHFTRLPVLTKFLQNQAALYSAGFLMAEEREQFEIVLEFHPELHGFVAGMGEVAATMALATGSTPDVVASPGLKSRVAHLIAGRAQQTSAEGLVMCGADGLVQAVNPAFTHMCGYTLGELRGKNLGPILQGAKTDSATAARMRSAVQERRPCRETILNYHKNGTPYWVQIAIAPIFDDEGELLCLVAREHELADPVAT